MGGLVSLLRRNAVLALLVLLQWPLGLLLNRALNPYYLQIVVYIGINGMLAVSLNLINGITGQFSLGHAGFMALGAYVGAAFTIYAWPYGVGVMGLAAALLAGGCAAAAAGLLVGMPTLRLRGDYLAIVTLGFGEIIRVVILNTEAVGGARGLSIPAAATFTSTYVCAVLCVGLLWRLVHSPKGTAFRAVREDEIAAAAMGVDTTRYKIIAFTLGAFWAGVAGGLFAHFIGYIHTNSFTFLKSIEIVVMVVLGGSGSISGALLAAAALTVLPELLRFGAEYRMIIYSLLLIVMMLTRPAGLLGSQEITQWRFWKLKTAR
ncbi:MAG: branched-chain amino acid ABC transporter permease [Deltaproteobacteria bacterium]|nr:branched-chain amino acid ABC transporter permease [Deltaproteobacteria bacterium]